MALLFFKRLIFLHNYTDSTNTVLRTGHDKIEQQAAATESDPGSRYGFTRGAAYFGGEKDD